MRRTTLLLVSMGVLVLFAAEAAFAPTPNCERGSEKADKMVGTAQHDELCGEGGNDEIRGKAGDDILIGGSENDTIYGGDGNDKIKGSTGADVIKAGDGDDIVRPGTHNEANDGARDVVDCGPGTDTVYYVPGQDDIRGCEILRQQ